MGMLREEDSGLNKRIESCNFSADGSESRLTYLPSSLVNTVRLIYQYQQLFTDSLGMIFPVGMISIGERRTKKDK